MPSGSRQNNFDALRFTLAVLVIYSHCFPLGTGVEAAEPFFASNRGQLTFGGFAVNCFFIISGYLITQSWARTQNFWSFMQKRIARIYPGFIVASAVCSWLIVPNAGETGGATFSWSYVLAFAKAVPLLRDPPWPQVFVSNPYPFTVNGSTWTILYEFLCYLALAGMALVGMITKRKLALLTFVISIVAQGALELAHVQLGNPKLTQVAMNCARFAALYQAGVVYYLYREQLRPSNKLTVAALVGLVVAARIPHCLVFAFPVLGAYLLFVVAFSSRIRLYGFAKYGDFSYGTYLYAFPIQQLLVHWYGRDVAPMHLFMMAAPLAVLVGALSWYLVERPFLRRKSSTLRRSTLIWAPAAEATLQAPKAD